MNQKRAKAKRLKRRLEAKENIRPEKRKGWADLLWIAGFFIVGLFFFIQPLVSRRPLDEYTSKGSSRSGPSSGWTSLVLGAGMLCMSGYLSFDYRRKTKKSKRSPETPTVADSADAFHGSNKPGSGTE